MNFYRALTLKTLNILISLINCLILYNYMRSLGFEPK